MKRIKGELPSFQKVPIIIIAVLLLVSYFSYKLFVLQVMNSNFYDVKSEENRIIRLVIPSTRGDIFDRNHKPIVTSKVSVELVATSRRLSKEKIDEITTRLSPLLDIDAGMIEKSYRRGLRNTYGYQPVPIIHHLTEKQIIHVAERMWQIPGIWIEKRQTRWYPYDITLSHTLGYVNEVTREDVKRSDVYSAGDEIGRAGIESVMEKYLKGIDGWRWAEVDAHGRITRTLSHLPGRQPQTGAHVNLTVDIELSKIFEEAFGDSDGFGILMNADNGAIRAMFSRPDYNPNLLVTTDDEYISTLRDNPGRPFFHRAVQSVFPPGSTFKIINFVAAVEEGIANKETTYVCKGKQRLGNRVFRCWKEYGHGKISLVPALVHSCNVFFYNTGLSLTVDEMSKYGKMFGLGTRTDTEKLFPGEPAGILPTKEWKKIKEPKEPWVRGDDMNMSIGQGYLLVSPLQQVSMMASLFNGGKVVKPYIVESVVANNGDTLYRGTPATRSVIDISDTTLSLIHKSLRQVVVKGTGYWAGHSRPSYRAYPVKVYGKTGTVQRASWVEGVKQVHEDHGWFLCYFEIAGEHFVAVVMKEAAGHGGTVAAPVVGRFIEEVLKKNKKS